MPRGLLMGGLCLSGFAKFEKAWVSPMPPLLEVWSRRLDFVWHLVRPTHADGSFATPGRQLIRQSTVAPLFFVLALACTEKTLPSEIVGFVPPSSILVDFVDNDGRLAGTYLIDKRSPQKRSEVSKGGKVLGWDRVEGLVVIGPRAGTTLRLPTTIVLPTFWGEVQAILIGSQLTFKRGKAILSVSCVPAFDGYAIDYPEPRLAVYGGDGAPKVKFTSDYAKFEEVLTPVFARKPFRPAWWSSCPAWVDNDTVFFLDDSREALQLVAFDIRKGTIRPYVELKQKSPKGIDDPISGRRLIYSNTSVDWIACIESGEIRFVSKPGVASAYKNLGLQCESGL